MPESHQKLIFSGLVHFAPVIEYWSFETGLEHSLHSRHYIFQKNAIDADNKGWRWSADFIHSNVEMRSFTCKFLMWSINMSNKTFSWALGSTTLSQALWKGLHKMLHLFRFIRGDQMLPLSSIWRILNPWGHFKTLHFKWFDIKSAMIERVNNWTFVEANVYNNILYIWVWISLSTKLFVWI